MGYQQQRQQQQQQLPLIAQRDSLEMRTAVPSSSPFPPLSHCMICIIFIAAAVAVALLQSFLLSSVTQSASLLLFIFFSFLSFSLAFPKPHLCRSVCVCCVCGVSIMHLAPRSRHSILYGLSTACELSARLCCQCRRHHTEASDHRC